MRVAFDLDDTLIPSMCVFPVEKPVRRFLARFLGHEPMRAGTARVLRHLAARGCEIWVYTTSYRSPFTVRAQFFLYGVWIGGVVNGDIHRARMIRYGASHKSCIKYPPAFGIDLLFDNSEAVWEEARRYDYRVVPVKPDDDNWADALIEKVEQHFR